MDREIRSDIREILNYIPVGSYEEWLDVGMALKEGGYDCSVWDDWSRSDSRYHDGECERKWAGFNGADSPVTMGTVFKMAKDNGWIPKRDLEPFTWDSIIGGHDEDLKIVQPEWTERKVIPAPIVKDPKQQIIKFLSAAFQQDDIVCWVNEVQAKEDGKLVPANKGHSAKAGELIRKLEKKTSQLDDVFGTLNDNAGAWIRINPMDGEGGNNANVVDFRYSLVESDAQDIETQYAILHELQLPIVTLVHSGKKSLHALVKIGADSYEEYRKRVDYLYKVCEKNGLQIDKANKNPSRLSRLPGVQRGEARQELLEIDSGQPSWDAWVEYVESANDDLPDPLTLSEVWDNMPPLSPELIHGILRKGHKMLLTGPSKAGKSFALIELAAAIAEGKEWLGFQCEKGRVMYVNMELDEASCFRRFKDIYESKGWNPEGLKNIEVWNLRGKAAPMDKLAAKLIRRAKKLNVDAVIIDPIYKVLTGDENSASDMALFCNMFDKIATELKASVIMCHHHSKGAQGSKKASDRGSGSGVFARDPDAVLDLIELEVDPETAQKRHAFRMECILREFESFEPIDLWFDYPVHYRDESGELGGCRPVGDVQPWERGTKANAGAAKDKRNVERDTKISDAYDELAKDGRAVKVGVLAKKLDLTERGFRYWIESSAFFEIDDGIVYRKILD